MGLVWLVVSGGRYSHRLAAMRRVKRGDVKRLLTFAQKMCYCVSV